jgi:hypothetical protein
MPGTQAWMPAFAGHEGWAAYVNTFGRWYYFAKTVSISRR